MSLSLFGNDTATTEIYTLSLHDALPIFAETKATTTVCNDAGCTMNISGMCHRQGVETKVRHLAELMARSEEHTSELQSRQYLVCRFLLESTTHTTEPPPLMLISTFCRSI